MAKHPKNQGQPQIPNTTDQLLKKRAQVNSASPKKQSSSKKAKSNQTKPKANGITNTAANPQPVVKPKRQRKAHATRPTESELLTIEERRALVLDLRKAGASIRQISDHLKQKGYESSSPATVHADLQAKLQELRERQQSSIQDIVTLQLERLETLHFCL